MLELIPASAIIAIVVIALMSFFSRRLCEGTTGYGIYYFRY